MSIHPAPIITMTRMPLTRVVHAAPDLMGHTESHPEQLQEFWPAYAEVIRLGQEERLIIEGDWT